MDRSWDWQLKSGKWRTGICRSGKILAKEINELKLNLKARHIYRHMEHLKIIIALRSHRPFDFIVNALNIYTLNSIGQRVSGRAEGHQRIVGARIMPRRVAGSWRGRQALQWDHFGHRDHCRRRRGGNLQAEGLLGVVLTAPPVPVENGTG